VGDDMGRQRDPKQDEAFEIYKASGGEINLNVIAAQLGVGDGTLRGWKAKDEWENNLKFSTYFGRSLTFIRNSKIKRH
jgi:uncharacterized protein YjcR